MKIVKIKSPITFGSGYPLGPGGHLRAISFTGAPNPHRYDPNMDNPFYYPGYPGMIPIDTRNPFGGILHNINYFA